MMNTAARRPARVLNVGPGPPDDGLEREWDVCPDCGCKRWQLILVPDRFYCDRCHVASLGPNQDVAEPEPEQIDLFASNEGAKPEAVADEPPIDEGMAWVAEEMPDE
jgi:ribosomal protein S27AE